MVAGSYNRREVTSRRVRYEIDTPVEGKTLGVVLANVTRELGDRAHYDDAFRLIGEEERVVIEFDTELTGGPLLKEGDEVPVQYGGGVADRRVGRLVRGADGGLEVFVHND